MNEKPRNLVDLKEYLEQVIQLRDERSVSEFKRVWDRFEAMAVAVNKFEGAQRERDEKANEFRSSLDDQAKRAVSRSELESETKGIEGRIEGIVARVASLEKYQFGLEGRGSGQSETRAEAEAKRSANQRTIAMLISIGFLLMGLLQFLLHYVK